MINISLSAQQYFKKLLSKEEIGTQIRIFVKNPGTLYAECEILYKRPSSVNYNDEILKLNDFIVYIDRFSIPYLKDAEIDLLVDNFNTELILNAPNLNKVYQISEDASLFERIEYILHSQINTKLSLHGGYVKLIEITNDMCVIIEFSGGCNGCSMVNITVKENIEATLLKFFPEINKIYDITEHIKGNHSYYK